VPHEDDNCDDDHHPKEHGVVIRWRSPSMRGFGKRRRVLSRHTSTIPSLYHWCALVTRNGRTCRHACSSSLLHACARTTNRCAWSCGMSGSSSAGGYHSLTTTSSPMGSRATMDATGALVSVTGATVIAEGVVNEFVAHPIEGRRQPMVGPIAHRQRDTRTTRCRHGASTVSLLRCRSTSPVDLRWPSAG
jgi:hypothetical protein